MKSADQIKFAAGTEFLDVEGIPVTLYAGEDATPGMGCAAWDTSPPRRFPGDSARRNGAIITKDAFLKLVQDSAGA